MAKSPANGRLARLNNKLARMANDVFKSPEYRRFLSLPLTPGRAAHYIFERSHFHLNRRQCWALVQAKAPFDVKQIIWHHEREELAGDKERGVENHWVLGMMEGETVGLTAKDFRRPPSESTMICAYAWAHIAQTAPWLEAISSSAMLEIANSDAIVKGGGIANRIARKMSRELHIPLRRQHSNKEHMEVDVMHANLLSQVAASHVRTKEDADMVLAGATQGLAVNRTWLGLLAEDMAKIA